MTSGEPPPVVVPGWLTFRTWDVRHVGIGEGVLARGVVIGDLRVQALERAAGRRSFTIVWPEGAVHQAADGFLREHDGSGTQRTYAYLLVDHLRWLEREALTLEQVTLRDLRRYMGLVGADVAGPHGEPWRAGRHPYGHSALQRPQRA